MSQKRKGRRASDAERALWTKTMSAVHPVRRPQNLAHNFAHDLKHADGASAHTELSSHSESFSEWYEAIDPSPNPAPSNRTPLAKAPSTALSSSSQSQHTKTNESVNLPRLDVGKTSGTDRRTADRLRRGKLDIDMRLDLHGLTLEVAHRRLLGFLNAARASGARCVLVITGKGSRSNVAGSGASRSGDYGSDGFGKMGVGRLKAAVPRWLNEPAFRPMVLSVTDAQPKDGGTGALYILLRKPNRGRP